MNYNKSLHDPTCTESYCTSIALKVDYIFNYFETKIVNATVRFYIKKVFLNVPFVTQEVNVKFLMANKSIDQLIKFSGSPGYLNGFPLIVSFSASNYTEDFYNTSNGKKNIPQPDNKDGQCVLSNMPNNVVFGANKRIKCRYYHERDILQNDTSYCERIQNKINQLLGLTSKFALSPFGNPDNVKDEDWITIQAAAREEPLYGEVNVKKSKLQCYNLVTRVSLIFTYADVSQNNKKENKIVSAKLSTTVRNVTFSMEEISTVLTFDTTFIDGTKPSQYEFAGGPHLNIHLPKDFFFPFPSNRSCVFHFHYNSYAIFVCIAAAAFYK